VVGGHRRPGGCGRPEGTGPGRKRLGAARPARGTSGGGGGWLRARATVPGGGGGDGGRLGARAVASGGGSGRGDDGVLAF
jgi:hypothetical protein